MDYIYNDKKFDNIIRDVMNDIDFKEIDTCVHHGISRLEHSLRVSYYSYKVTKVLGLNYKEVARAGLLHDFFLSKNISKKEKFEGCCELRCKANEIRYIEESAVTKNIDIFNNYKVFVSKSAGNPNSDFKVIGIPYIGEKRSACTDSLIPIGNFKTLYEATSLQKYIKTKFLRFMVSILKTSQNVTQIVYRFVPMQDFSKSWK